jgi:pentatricopeptide repeat protein
MTNATTRGTSSTTSNNANDNNNNSSITSIDTPVASTTPNTTSSVEDQLNEMLNQHKLDDAMRFLFELHDDHASSTHQHQHRSHTGNGSLFVDTRIYVSLMRELVNEHRFERAEELLDAMRSWHVRPSISLYQHLIRGYCTAPSSSSQSTSIDPRITTATSTSTSTITTNSSGSGATSNSNDTIVPNELQRAFDLVNEMQRHDLAVPANIYGALIQACVRHGLVQRAFGVMQEMLANGLVPNAQAYNALIEACLANRDSERALELVRQLRNGPSNLRPSVVTYNTVIQGLVRMDERKKALAFLLELGSEADVVMFTTLLHAFVHANELDLAFEALGHMSQRNIAPDTAVCNALIHACRLLGDYERALSIRADMLANGVPLDIITYTSLMEVFLAAKQPQRVFETFDELLSRGLTPNLFTYECLVRSYASVRDYDGGLAVLAEMRERGISPLVHCYNILIRTAASEHSHLPRALEMFDSMLALDIVPTPHSCHNLMNCCAKVGALDRALHILEAMHRYRLADVTAYTIVIKAYITSNQIDRALELLKTMRLERNIVPDTMLYNTVIDGCRRHRRFSQGLALFDSMTVPPDSHSYTAAMWCATTVAKVRELWTSMERAGIVPNSHHYAASVSAICRSGDIRQACRVAELYLHSNATWSEHVFSALQRVAPEVFRQFQARNATLIASRRAQASNSTIIHPITNKQAPNKQAPTARPPLSVSTKRL